MTKDIRTPALDPMSLEPDRGFGYPAPFRQAAGLREKRALGDAVGLTHYGVNLVHIDPGGWSAQRHWHSHEGEFVFVLEGELTLVTDAGERHLLGPARRLQDRPPRPRRRAHTYGSPFLCLKTWPSGPGSSTRSMSG